MTAHKFLNYKGFTLIELLIVMAILGVLAVVVLVAINPVQQLARTRDAGRKSGVTQIGHAMEAYFTARGGTYVDETAFPAWVSQLVTAGELASAPGAIGYGSGVSACTTNAENDWCYASTGAVGTDPAVVFTILESDSETAKCDAAGTPFFIWSTADGRGGLVCLAAGEPAPGAQTWNSVQ